MHIKPGDVIPTRQLRVIMQDGKGWIDFRAGQSRCFVVLLLGIEDIKPNGHKLDFMQALKELGWMPIKDPNEGAPSDENVPVLPPADAGNG